MSLDAIPLWPDNTTSKFSSIFSVSPGYACFLTAHGLEGKNLTTDTSVAASYRCVCIHRLILGHDAPPPGDACACGWVYETTGHVSKVVRDTVPVVGKCMWTLTQCRNAGIIAIPGVYQLEVSDPSILGTFQVFAEKIAQHQMPLVTNSPMVF